MESVNEIRFLMDESSAPYEQKENPFTRTSEDEEFDNMIIRKYQLITKEMEKVNS